MMTPGYSKFHLEKKVALGKGFMGRVGSNGNSGFALAAFGMNKVIMYRGYWPSKSGLMLFGYKLRS